MAKTPDAETTKPARGRPPGQATQKPVVSAAASRCPKCGSTNRTPYTNTKTMAFDGTDAQGQPYTHILWRSTKCEDCGQHRRDRTTENRPGDDE